MSNSEHLRLKNAFFSVVGVTAPLHGPQSQNESKTINYKTCNQLFNKQLNHPNAYHGFKSQEEAIAF